jgi:hypothetical protein
MAHRTLVAVLIGWLAACSGSGGRPVGVETNIPLNDVDQVVLARGPIVNVPALGPVILVGAGDGAYSGTPDGGVDPVLEPGSGQKYGACVLRDVPSNTQPVIAFGPNGVNIRNWLVPTQSWSMTFVEAPQGDMNTTDAVATANDPDSAEGIVVRNGLNRIQFFRYDASLSAFQFSSSFLAVHLFPGANGKMISACRPEVDGPLFVLFNSAASQLFVKDDPDDLATPAELVATLGSDAVRVRHEGNLIFTTSRGDDTMSVLRREAGGLPTLVETVAVGDGPLGIDTDTLPNGDIAALTTGYNDHTFTITIVSAGGMLISNEIHSVSGGGLNPGSGVLLPDGRVAIACNGSDEILCFVPPAPPP